MTLFVAITVDLDNDGLALSDERNQLSWRGLEKVPSITEVIRLSHWPVTWFIRADPQIKSCYGSAAYLLDRHAELWRGLAGQGDEIAWHPHLTRVNDQGLHEPERDDAKSAAALRATYAELITAGYRFESVRLGEAFNGNASLRTLAELGLRVDSSAIPGRRRNDGSRFFDWTGTPNRPYRPSTMDYRIPGHPTVAILEVPMTVIPVQGPDDPHPLPRYANLAYRPSIFRDALARWLEAAAPWREDMMLTTILHPDELTPGGRHPLYAFSLEALRANIDHLIAMAAKCDIDIVGVTVGAVARDRYGSFL